MELLDALRAREPAVGHVLAAFAVKGALPDALMMEALASDEESQEMSWMRLHVEARKKLLEFRSGEAHMPDLIDFLLQKGLSWAALEYLRMSDSEHRQEVARRIRASNPYTRRQRSLVLQEIHRLCG